MTTQQTVELPIVERLRWWEGDGHPHGLLHRDAADALEAQAALIKEAVEALTAMVARAPERDTKWAGMTARDIALVTLTKLTGEKQ
jgi:hypothetical protein